MWKEVIQKLLRSIWGQQVPQCDINPRRPKERVRVLIRKFKSVELDMPKASSTPDLSLSLANKFFPKLKAVGLGFSATSNQVYPDI